METQTQEFTFPSNKVTQTQVHTFRWWYRPTGKTVIPVRVGPVFETKDRTSQPDPSHVVNVSQGVAR